MKIRSGFIAALISVLTALFVICSVSPSARAQNSSNEVSSAASEWLGGYEFFNAPPVPRRNAPTPSIAYSITVFKKGNQLLARFEANGFQTALAYECTVKISGNGGSEMKLYFLRDSYGDGSEDFSTLKKGNLVFSLTKVRNGGKMRYLFKPGVYQIDLMSGRQRTPIYFTKSK